MRSQTGIPSVAAEATRRREPNPTSVGSEFRRAAPVCCNAIFILPPSITLSFGSDPTPPSPPAAAAAAGPVAIAYLSVTIGFTIGFQAGPAYVKTEGKYTTWRVL
jgi:hypothetical protein